MASALDDLTAILAKHESQLNSLFSYVERVLLPFNPLYLELEQAAQEFRRAHTCLRSYKDETETFAKRTLEDIRSEKSAVAFATQASRLQELQKQFETVKESFDNVLDVLVDVKARAAHGKKDSTVAAVCSAGQILGPISMLNHGAILTFGGPVIGGISTGFYVADQLPTDNKMLKFLCGMAVGGFVTFLCLKMPGLHIALRAIPCVASTSATALSLVQRSEFKKIIEQTEKVQLMIDEYKISLLKLCQVTANASRRLETVSESRRITQRRVESIEKAMESLLLL